MEGARHGARARRAQRRQLDITARSWARLPGSMPQRTQARAPSPGRTCTRKRASPSQLQAYANMCTHMQSDAIRCNPIQSDGMQSDVNQMQSEALDSPTSRHPESSATSGPQRCFSSHQRYSAPLRGRTANGSPQIWSSEALSGRTANGSPQISQRSRPRVARCIGLATARASWRATRSPRRCTCRSSPHKDRASCRARGSVRGRRHQSASVGIRRHHASSSVIRRHQASSVVIRRHPSPSVALTCPRKAYSRMHGTIAAAHATTSDELATSFRKST